MSERPAHNPKDRTGDGIFDRQKLLDSITSGNLPTSVEEWRCLLQLAPSVSMTCTVEGEVASGTVDIGSDAPWRVSWRYEKREGLVFNGKMADFDTFSGMAKYYAKEQQKIERLFEPRQEPHERPRNRNVYTEDQRIEVRTPEGVVILIPRDQSELAERILSRISKLGDEP